MPGNNFEASKCKYILCMAENKGLYTSHFGRHIDDVDDVDDVDDKSSRVNVTFLPLQFTVFLQNI